MKHVTGMGCVWDSPEHNEIEALRTRVVGMQRQLNEVRRENIVLRGEHIKALRDLRDLQNAMIDKTLERLSK